MFKDPSQQKLLNLSREDDGKNGKGGRRGEVVKFRNTHPLQICLANKVF